MIKIYLNGKENKIEKNQTINDLLDSQGLKEKMIAVAINMKIIHKKKITTKQSLWKKTK